MGKKLLLLIVIFVIVTKQIEYFFKKQKFKLQNVLRTSLSCAGGTAFAHHVLRI